LFEARGQASLIEYGGVVIAMVVAADSGIGPITHFDVVEAVKGDTHQPVKRFDDGFLYTRLEPLPLYDTDRIYRRTEISEPLIFSGFSSLDTLWNCDEGLCAVETLLFTANCGEPMPF
jgi:hypothetical protein